MNTNEIYFYILETLITLACEDEKLSEEDISQVLRFREQIEKIVMNE